MSPKGQNDPWVRTTALSPEIFDVKESHPYLVSFTHKEGNPLTVSLFS